MRQPVRGQKPAKVQVVDFPAPVGGWVSNRALAMGRSEALPPGAAVLDNFFPTATGVLLRRGYKRHHRLSVSPVKSLFRYLSGNQEQVFASYDGRVFDVTHEQSEDLPVVLFEGTNPDWRTQQITTTGGTFLIGVNGTDPGWIYDGTTFSALNVTFAGSVTTDDISYVWVYANRLWFIERGTMNAWYLAADTISGEAVKLPIGGEFQRGGAIMFGQSWSLSSGASGGLSEQCVFVSTEGEVAVFQGIDPGSASSWAKVGLYRIGKPLGVKAFVRAGGDLLIATTIGMVSLTTAVQKDFSALGTSAVSYPIEEAWTKALRDRGPTDWRCFLWPEQRMLVVAPPKGEEIELSECFVANVNTGAWARFTGWNILSMEGFNGEMLFGTYDGLVNRANVTGMDESTPYSGCFIPLFDPMGQPAVRKIARNARTITRSVRPVRTKLTAMFDFNTNPPPVPDPVPVPAGSFWGGGKWGEAMWGEEVKTYVDATWRSLGGAGHDASICLQVTSGSVVPVDVELVRIDATIEYAGVMS